MPDIFDTLEAPKTDIFDQIATDKKGDIFDQVSASPAAASAPVSASDAIAPADFWNGATPPAENLSALLTPAVSPDASVESGSYRDIGGERGTMTAGEAGKALLEDVMSPGGNFGTGVELIPSAIAPKDFDPAHPPSVARRAVAIAQNIASGLAGFVLSPAGALLPAAGAASPLLGTAIAGGFAAEGLKALPEDITEIAQAKTPAERDAAITKAATHALMVGAVAHPAGVGGRSAKALVESRAGGLSAAEADALTGRIIPGKPSPESVPAEPLVAPEIAPLTAQAASEPLSNAEPKTTAAEATPIETTQTRVTPEPVAAAPVPAVADLKTIQKDSAQWADTNSVKKPENQASIPDSAKAITDGTIVRSKIYGSEGDITIQGEPHVEGGRIIYDAYFSGSRRSSSIEARHIDEIVSRPDVSEPIIDTPEKAAETTPEARDKLLVDAYNHAERLAEELTAGQPDSVREAAFSAAYDNARQSVDKGGQFNPDFMRKSAMSAAGKEAAKLGTSLDVPVEEGASETKTSQVPEPTPSPDNAEVINAMHSAADNALSPRDAQIFRDVSAGEKTMEEIGTEHGISKQAVSQMMQEAMPKVRRELERAGWTKDDYAGGPGAMGPVEALEMKISGAERNTALKRAAVDAQAEERGAEPIPTPTRLHREEIVRNAEDALDADPTLAQSIISRIVDKGDKAINEVEAATLLVERQRVLNERRAWEEKLGRAEDVPAARAALEDIETRMHRLDQASRAAGSTWSDVGRMYQNMIRDDYTLDSLERKMRAKLERPLTEGERAEVKKSADDISAAEKAAESERVKAGDAAVDEGVHRMYEATINELGKSFLEKPSFGKEVFDIARGVVDRWKASAEEAHKSLRERLSRTSAGVDPTILVDVAKIVRAKIGEFGLSKAEVAAELLAEYGPKIKAYVNKAWDEAHKLIAAEKIPEKAKEVVKRGTKKKGESTPQDIRAKAKAEAVAGDELSHKTVYEYVKALINSGVHGEDPVMKAAHEGLKEFFPEATERDIRRAYSEYGKVKFPSKEATAAEMRELRTLTRLQESIDRSTKDSLDPLHTGLQRDKASQLVREKTRQLNELLKKREGPTSPEKLASRQEAKQTALRNAIEDLDKQLRTGEKPVKGEPATDSPQTEQLRAERDAMKAKLQEIEDAAHPGKTEAEKQVDQLSKIRDRLDETLSGKRPQNAPKDFNPLSQAAEDLKAEILAMQELSAQMRRDAKPPGDPGAISEKAKIKALEDSIARYEDKLSRADFSIQGPKLGPDSARVAQLKAVRDARAEAYDAAKKAGRPVRSPEERYNATRLKAVEKRIAELEAKMKAGDFSKTVRQPTPQKNAATRAAEVKLAETKLQFDRKLKEIELSKRGRAEKIMDGIAKWNRAFILSGVHTLLKLTSAATEIIAIAPIEEAVGGVIGKAIPRIAEKAPRHGGFSPRAEAAAVVGTWRNLLKDAGSAFKTGHTELDALYGRPDIMPRELKDYIGQVHYALKTPAMRNEFIRSFEKALTHAEKNGMDIQDPMVQMKLSVEAYKNSKKAIFSEDNMVVNMWKRALSALRQVDPATGRPTLRGKIAETAMKFTLPIVRIPTNIVNRTFEYSLGTVSGSARIARALTKGLDNLHPDEADAIMRNMKRGSVGAALMLYGYLNPDTVGGYYQPGEKRKEGDVKAGRIKVAGVEVPSYLIHNPAIEQIQIGSTIRRVADSKLRKKDMDTQGIGNGVMAAALGLAEETPFVNEMLHLSKLFSPHERGTYGGEMIRKVVPQGVQQVAQMMDKRPNGEPVMRKPTGVVENIELGIPGLRKRVPEKSESSNGSTRGTKMPSRKF